MCQGAFIGNTEFRLQSFGISKGNAGESATEPPGINTEYDGSFSLIVEIPLIKPGDNGHHLWVFAEWIHDLYSVRKGLPAIPEIFMKINGPGGECFCG